MRTDRADKTKVVYIAGCGRSGSTLLDRILGEAPGFAPVGELRNMWNWGLKPTANCGCGLKLRQCGFWQAVFDEAFGGFAPVDSRSAFPSGYPYLPRTDALRLLLPWRSQRYRRQLEAHAASLEALYRAVAHVAGARGIIDSSKRFEYAYLLSLIPSVDLRVIHLVRDSRAMVQSELKHAREKWASLSHAETFLDARGVVAWRTIAWVGNQLLSEMLQNHRTRYLLLRYEDFASDPAATIARIGEFIDEDLSGIPFVGDRAIRLSRKHAALGNPLRFQQGTMDIRPDTKWQRDIAAMDGFIVTALTWPLLARYGYVDSGLSTLPPPARASLTRP